MSLVVTNTTLTVSWPQPVEDGGRTDLYYQVEWSGSNPLELSGSVYVSGSSRIRTFTGFKSFTKFCVRVTAHNGVSDQDHVGLSLRRVMECTVTLPAGMP